MSITRPVSARLWPDYDGATSTERQVSRNADAKRAGSGDYCCKGLAWVCFRAVWQALDARFVRFVFGGTPNSSL